jgi:RNA polymerase I-specific transcription initiation factor RRN3
LEDLENDESAPGQESIFELDPFDAIVGQGKVDSESEVSDDGDDGEDCLSDISSDAEDMDDDDVADVPPNVPHIQDMVRKLDAILKLLFDYFHRTHVAIFLPPTPPPSQSDFPFDSMDGSPSLASSVLHSAEKSKFLQRTQFHSLLSVFQRTIIHTFKSRYTQFLLFWFSSLDPEFSDLFQGFLVSKALIENELPVVTRVAAASYIGSFISRAQFIDREGTRRLMSVLCRFLKGHLDAFDSQTQTQTGDSLPTHTHHNVFYAVTQAVLLIFCFRWSEMLEEHDQDEEILEPKSGRKWMAELDVLRRVVSSPLNPLKVSALKSTRSSR